MKPNSFKLAGSEISSCRFRAAKGLRKRLGKTLIELGYLTEPQMAKALSTQLNLAMVDLMAEQIPDQIIQMVPRETAEREVLFPIDGQATAPPPRATLENATGILPKDRRIKDALKKLPR